MPLEPALIVGTFPGDGDLEVLVGLAARLVYRALVGGLAALAR
jgi:hypothetical protein